MRKRYEPTVLWMGHTDFLHIMKRMEDKEWKEWAAEADGPCYVSTLKIIPKLTQEEIISQCRFLTSAGFDTTANTLTYLTYLLANHPAEQNKLWAEVETLNEITFASVQLLKYLHYAIMETLRLFPHASMLQSRVCVQQCVIGPCTFRKGLGIIFDTWSLHRDSSVWGGDAEQFKPERFANRTEQQMLSWMPFGAGPRQCIGMRFALLETKVVICRMMKRFQFRKVEDSREVGLPKI
ncbi:unnamed protein product [Gongylonema pulchrum]|uniref:Cytochrome P450 n=1 Tax=Gongylonema pulchrum TaxID=637853 RepID=A0A183CXC3_9BILA|nr:unnamed protein product [Gongylonema pulchrum]